ncbi:type IV conjugative transfer system lipoprotein TraV [Rhodanobacter sp. FW106-PBR-R2A-1-13]|uniref:type IV conjugative transfer system lipoprotein TraV n=1 Tax=Rhodanobacter sp. FW106-PBR-R2A-1-13 TaxID=3454845 RepID=UPI0034E43BA2
MALVVTAGAALSACATTKYQCPTPTGVACSSAPDVYHMTDAPGKAGMAATSKVFVDKGHRHADAAPAESVETAATTGSVVPLPKAGDVIPIREQARVMRVWVAPWVDANGNLTMASRVYTEIEAKRWSVGEEAMPTNTDFYPLQVEATPPPTSTAKTSASTPGFPVATPGKDSQLP